MRLLLVCISCILLPTFSGAAEDAFAGMCQKPFSLYCQQLSYTPQQGNNAPECRLTCDVKIKSKDSRIFCRSALPYLVTGVRWANNEVFCDYKASVACPQNTMYVGKCVKYYNKPMKYSDALKTCQNQSANIAVPDNGLQLEFFSELISPDEVATWQTNTTAMVIWPIEYYTIMPGSIIDVHPDSPLTFFCEFPTKYYVSAIEGYCKTLEKMGLKVSGKDGECYLQSSNLYSGLYVSDAGSKIHKDCDKMTTLSSRAAITWTSGETWAMQAMVAKSHALSAWVPSTGEPSFCHQISYSKSLFFIGPRGRTKSYGIPESMLMASMDCPINDLPLTDYLVVSVGSLGLLPMGLGNELPFICKVGDDAMIKTKDCEPGWNRFVRYGGVVWCTKFIYKSLPYKAAENECFNIGARISSIEGDVEWEQFVDQAIQTALIANNLIHGSVWLGADIRAGCRNDKAITGNCGPDQRFIWSDGVVSGPYGFHHWNEGEPNNFDGKEDAVQLMIVKDTTSKFHGKLNDLDGKVASNNAHMSNIGFFCGKVGDVDN